MIRITLCDKRWLRDNQPGIVAVSESAVEGDFHIRAIKGAGKFEFAECPACQEGDGFVDDMFRIRACFAGDIPCVYETGGRFERIARENQAKTGKSICECRFDLHIYGDGRLCLAHPAIIPVILRDYPGIRGAFKRLLAPYFYFHAYRDKYGNFPWRGLSHNMEIATLEQIYFSRDNCDKLDACLQFAKSLGLIVAPDSSGALQQKLCLCDSGKRMSECHPDAFKGARILAGKNR